MDWSRSYSATWRVFRVNRSTWADAEQITNVDSVGITRTANGSLLEAGDMEVTGDFDSDYYRIVMTAEQGGEVQRVDVGTLLFESYDGTIDYGVATRNAEGYSVLYPAEMTKITAGSFAPLGYDGAQYCKELLETTINAPVRVEGSFILNDHIVHEIGSTVLEAVWAVLDAGGFVIQIDGRGVVHIMPKPTEDTLVIANTNLRLLQNGIDYSGDTSEIPNRYIVIVGNNRTVVTNDSETSPISSVNRGYYVDEVDESPTPINGETIAEYATRKLREMSVMSEEYSYTREYAPDVYAYSIVKASINGMMGDLRVTSQSIECGHGITVQEKAEKEVSLWQ